VQGFPAVIELPNDFLTADLTAINRYFVHSKMCANWGYKRRADHHHEESIGEMKDADELSARILVLEGEERLDWIETQVHLLAELDVAHYLAHQVHE